MSFSLREFAAVNRAALCAARVSVDAPSAAANEASGA
jgi:hypothetical protein